MTEPINDRCWEYYGFPNPEFMEPRLPWLGLLRALAERYKHVFGGITDEDIFGSDNPGGLFSEYDIPAVMTRYKSGGYNPDWGPSYEKVFRQVCSRFLNHTKMEDLDNINTSSDFMWTLEDLQAAAAEILGEDVISQNEKLSPIWPLKWLRQQYTMINLLRMTPVDYERDRYHGSNILVYSKSFHDAFTKAKEDLHQVEHMYFDEPWVEVNAYCAWNMIYAVGIEAFSECRVKLPDDSPPGDSWLVAKFIGASGNQESFGLTYGKVNYGWNIIKADPDGIFLRFDPYQIQESDVPVPKREETVLIGWRPEQAYAFHDLNESFYFKQEDTDA